MHNIPGLYLIWISCAYFCYGGHYSIFPTVTAKLYGPKTGPKIYPLIFSGFAISTILGVVMAKVIIPKLKHLEERAYNPIFYTQGGMTVAALLLGLTFKEKLAPK